MRNKYITYRFFYSTICITLLFCDWWILPHTQWIHQSHNWKHNKVYSGKIVRNYFLQLLKHKINHFTRFGAVSVRNAYYLLDYQPKKSSSSFPFSPPPCGWWWGGRGGKGRTGFFGRYLISNGHFLRSPYQIYQRNLFYLLIIVINNCVQFSYCTLCSALQLRDWWIRGVWGRVK